LSGAGGRVTGLAGAVKLVIHEFGCVAASVYNYLADITGSVINDKQTTLHIIRKNSGINTFSVNTCCAFPLMIALAIFPKKLKKVSKLSPF
jgi:hypothetical protein